MSKQTDPNPSDVVEGFFAVEKMLRRALPFVPYDQKHLPVWSPRFTTIILEAASQADSLWKAAYHSQCPSKNKKSRPDIRQYFEHFGGRLAPQWVVFFGGAPPSLIEPFKPWRGAKFSKASYDDYQLPWWHSYNKLKHDRLSNFSKATLQNAVDAVAALFLAIIYSGMCDGGLINARLFEVMSPTSVPIGNLKNYRAPNFAKIESKLFVHPIGWCEMKVHRNVRWHSQSPRFGSWWYTFEQDGKDPSDPRSYVQ